ncbi:MAG: hypothetical protein M1335_06710 [Chloroflexi bacterium]|nr:hypothetical protein [Chloroflexota bacterium]
MKDVKASRQNSKLEAAGAELLVLGELLIEGIQAYKSHTNLQGYDLVAFNPQTDKACRIQVKSRAATDYDRSFLISDYDCDFVILAALNRGYRQRRKPNDTDSGRRAPQFYILPIAAVELFRSPQDKWGKVRVAEADSYLDNWDLIKDFLGFELD